MQDLNDFVWFVKVVEYGGFAAAGRALDQPKSKLSRRIAQLEERLGVRLIQRTTRQFTVTEVGHTFYQHCKAMLIEAEAAEEAVAALQAEPRGVVRITCPVTLLHVHVGPMLARFMARYPAAAGVQTTRCRYAAGRYRAPEYLPPLRNVPPDIGWRPLRRQSGAGRLCCPLQAYRQRNPLRRF